MKKQIKDLTADEIDKFCEKYGGCRKCPLYKGGRFICSAKEYLEIEVEIEENDKKGNENNE